MPDKLTITLLGAPHVAVNGRALHFASVKATALLAFLATSGRLHDRAELAALLWPESDTKRARGALRYTLSLLKKALPDACLLIDRRQIGLDPAADWQADVVTLRRQLAAALAPGSDLTDPRDLAGVEQGIAAYRADFLHGFTLADCPDFNDWAFTQREALRRDLAAALKQVAAVYQQRRQWDTAVAYAHRWLDLDPLHEPAHCRLMQLYAAAQEWTAVQNQFQALTDLLQRELQCPPQPETVRLYDALLRQRETAVASARPLAGLTRDQRSRHVLLQKVRRFWVNPVLKPLQESQAYLSLQLAGANHQIDHPWADVLPDAAPAAAAADIVQAFRHADRALLLLGAPGAGKTTSLVALTRHLLAQAGDDAAAQMPVLLNLSSWAAEGGAVGAWVVEEMVAKYQIPRRLGRRWLAADRLLFLFDGLDEMPAAARAACIAALNEFRQTHGLPDMVVCCRLAAYEAAVQQQGVRLLLSGAVAIRPLTTQQIRQQLPRPLAELVFRDAALLDMAQSPLTLAMLRVALRGEPGRPAAAPPAAREDLFAQYVRGVLDRQYGKGHAPVAQDELTRQLSWLARQMERHNQSI
ncbi:MAG: NACHT domain-containing protein, partial [Anaerolineales bacterium]|nr:NACHT domain-containing protein [Anaerolineales bacterium]